MQKLVECVPNFSEGRDRGDPRRDRRGRSAGWKGCGLLDVDPGAATNRTVVTLVGSPEAVDGGGLPRDRQGGRADRHEQAPRGAPADGRHRRLPVRPGLRASPWRSAPRSRARWASGSAGSSASRSTSTSRPPRVPSGSRLAEHPRRRVRGARGRSSKDPQWKPDFGPAEFNPRTGATVIGAREFLIAYNVNLNTRDKKLANEIALHHPRDGAAEAGRRREAGGRRRTGTRSTAPGCSRRCAPSAGTSRSTAARRSRSTSSTPTITPPHVAFEACVEEARKLGLRVTGSELVGLIPRSALLEAGTFYLARPGKSTGVPERELVHTAVRSLGLSELGAFDLDKKIIEYAIRDAQGLARRDDRARLRRRAVVRLARARRRQRGGALRRARRRARRDGGQPHDRQEGARGTPGNRCSEVAPQGQELKDWFLAAVDEDTAAFNRVMDAFRLPGKTPGGDGGQGAGGAGGDQGRRRGAALGARAVARGARPGRGDGAPGEPQLGLRRRRGGALRAHLRRGGVPQRP